MAATPAPDLADLAGLCGLRSAPVLNPSVRGRLRAELESRLAACAWFTVGVMAGSGSDAVAALRATERALAWTPLAPDPSGPDPETLAEPVFLKGNQHTGRFLLRAEGGLGQGILITGHNPEDPSVEDTWGPLPLDFFED
jgi:hypothetical protein